MIVKAAEGASEPARRGARHPRPGDAKHYTVACELPPGREPDLVPERRPGSSGSEGFCRRDGDSLVVRVRNQTSFDVSTPTTTRVLFSPGGTASQSTPPIPAGSFADASFVIPAGCFDSDCDFTITVDAEDQVDESHGDQPDHHEANNVEDGICIG